MDYQAIMKNLYSLRLEEINDEHLLSEHLLSKQLTLEVKKFEESVKLTKDYEIFLMKIFSAYIENIENIVRMNEVRLPWYGDWTEKRFVKLHNKKINIGFTSFAEVMWSVDKKNLRLFFEKNENFAIEFLTKIIVSNELEKYAEILGHYVFKNIIKKLPDEIIDLKGRAFLLFCVSPIEKKPHLIKKLSISTIESFFEKSKQLSLIENTLLQNFEEKIKLSFHIKNLNIVNKQELMASIKSDVIEDNEIACYFQLPDIEMNTNDMILAYRNMLELNKRLKNSKYRIRLVVKKSLNEINHIIIKDYDDIEAHLKLCETESKRLSVNESLNLFSLSLAWKTALFLDISQKNYIKEKEKNDNSLERLVLECNFSDYLLQDYLYLLEKIPSTCLTQIEVFLKDFPEYKEKETGRIKEEGLEIFELNYLY